ncbi:hypothetical protein L9H42_003997 [Klebsiella quasipneumoniae]|nr:hypothetical protein [Klebsiella quasipneumoniae]
MTEKRAGVNRKICVKSEEKAANMKKIHLPARMDAAQEEFDPMKFEAVQKTSISPYCHSDCYCSRLSLGSE